MLLDIISGLITIIAPNDTPTSPCPQLFNYFDTFDGTNGLITLDRLPEGITDVQAEFLQAIPMPEDIADKPIIRHVELINKTVQIRIEFNDPDNPPILDKLYVNKTVVCSGKHVLNACGLEGASQYIYGGTELKPGEFPWKVALLVEPRVRRFFTTMRTYVCGGTLISARTIVTAAHCLTEQRASDLKVYLGRHDLRRSDEQYAIERDVEKSVMHPDYRGTSDGDIAIVYVADIGGFNAFIRPICLWDKSMKTSSYNGKTGSVAGWGAVEQRNLFKPIAKRADVKIVRNKECIRNNPSYIYQMSDRSMCAGNLDGTGPCSGDSGSGLVLKIKGRWTLRGVVSTGLADGNWCDLYSYIIYVDVSKYMDWLLENLL